MILYYINDIISSNVCIEHMHPPTQSVKQYSGPLSKTPQDIYPVHLLQWPVHLIGHRIEDLPYHFRIGRQFHRKGKVSI
jgi:hypothetical protein